MQSRSIVWFLVLVKAYFYLELRLFSLKCYRVFAHRTKHPANFLLVTIPFCANYQEVIQLRSALSQ